LPAATRAVPTKTSSSKASTAPKRRFYRGHKRPKRSGAASGKPAATPAPTHTWDDFRQTVQRYYARSACDTDTARGETEDEAQARPPRADAEDENKGPDGDAVERRPAAPTAQQQNNGP